MFYLHAVIKYKCIIKGQLQCKIFVTQISLFIHAMHKTAIFIIQLCVVFELFAIRVVKRHFRLDFMTSRWVKAITDFHWMERVLLYGVIHEKSQQSGTID